MQSMREAMFRIAAIILVLMGVVGSMLGQSSGSSLEDGFKPPHSAKPRVWWHWMNGYLRIRVRLDLIRFLRLVVSSALAPRTSTRQSGPTLLHGNRNPPHDAVAKLSITFDS